MADRWKVATGIYRGRDGSWEVFVRIKPLPLKHRHYPASLTLKDVKEKRVALQRELARAAKHQAATAGSLAADMPTFLATLKANPRLQAERAQQLACWLAHRHDLGRFRRHEVPVDQLQDVLNDWAADGYAYSTLAHRRDALLTLYTALDKRIPITERPANPVTDTRLPLKKPDPEPRGLPLPVVLEILDAVSDKGGVVRKGDPTKPKGARGGRHDVSLARIRIHVMAYTGLRHSELKRYVLSDWRRATHDLQVRPGKGCTPRVIPLIPEAEAWLQQLEDAHGIGPFDNGVISRAFNRALAKVGLIPQLAAGAYSRRDPKARRRAVPGKGAGGPARPRTGYIRPYDLRHSLLTELTIVTGNTDAAQWQGGHKQRETSMRYNLNAVSPVLRAATEEYGRRIAAAQQALADAKAQQNHEGERLPGKVTGRASA